MKRNDILAFLKSHKKDMGRIYGVEHIGLFGSHARDAARIDSDIDIVVEIEAEKKTLTNFLGLNRLLKFDSSRRQYDIRTKDGYSNSLICGCSQFAYA